MDKKIDLEEILTKAFNGKYWDIPFEPCKKAMLDFGKQLLELAAENAKVDISMYYPDTERNDYIQEVICDHYNDREWHLSVDKESIINTIEEIKQV